MHVHQNESPVFLQTAHNPGDNEHRKILGLLPDPGPVTAFSRPGHREGIDFLKESSEPRKP